MGQAEIYAYLKINPKKKFTSNDLAKIFICHPSALTNALKRLRDKIAVHDPRFKYKLIRHAGVPYFLYWYNPLGKKISIDERFLWISRQ